MSMIAIVNQSASECKSVNIWKLHNTIELAINFTQKRIKFNKIYVTQMSQNGWRNTSTHTNAPAITERSKKRYDFFVSWQPEKERKSEMRHESWVCKHNRMHVRAGRFLMVSKTSVKLNEKASSDLASVHLQCIFHWWTSDRHIFIAAEIINRSNLTRQICS